jgi:hypothetical protein
MRQLLATLVLGSVLAAMVPAAFAADNDRYADKGVPAFGPVTLDTGENDPAVAGSTTQQTWEQYYHLQNRGQ